MKSQLPNSHFHMPWRGLSLELRKIILDIALNVPSTGAIFQGSFDGDDEGDAGYDSEEQANVLPEVEAHAYLVKPIRQWINTDIMMLNHEALQITEAALYRRLRLNHDCEDCLEFLEDLSNELRFHIKEISLGEQTVFFDDAPNGCFDSLCSFIIKNLRLDVVELPVFEDHGYYITAWYHQLGRAVWEARLPKLVLRYSGDSIPDKNHTPQLLAVGAIYSDYEKATSDTSWEDLMMEDEAQACDAHRSRYPFKFEFTKAIVEVPISFRLEKTVLAFVTMLADAKTAEARIEAAVEKHRNTGKDPDDGNIGHSACGVPRFEERVARLRRGLQAYYQHARKLSTNE